MNLLSKLFNFVVLTTSKYSIDESHGIKHSMDILHFASDIYQDEIYKQPLLEKHERIIYVSAILHDMCDKKYVNENEGIANIEEFLQEKISEEEIDVTKEIISTMSYSTVKKYGFPNLHEYQMAYHIVREADLLCAYDFDRCMIYNINQKYDINKPVDINTIFTEAEILFDNRMFKHLDDKLFVTDYSKNQALYLQSQALIRIDGWRKLTKSNVFKL
jgi:hypothetical protein